MAPRASSGRGGRRRRSPQSSDDGRREVDGQRRVPVHDVQRDRIGRRRADQLVGDEAGDPHRGRRTRTIRPNRRARPRGRRRPRPVGQERRRDARRRRRRRHAARIVRPPQANGRDPRCPRSSPTGCRHRAGARSRCRLRRPPTRGVGRPVGASVRRAVDDVRDRDERHRPKEADSAPRRRRTATIGTSRHAPSGARSRPQIARTRRGGRARTLVEEPHADGRHRADDRRRDPESDVRPRVGR